MKKILSVLLAISLMLSVSLSGFGIKMVVTQNL